MQELWTAAEIIDYECERAYQGPHGYAAVLHLLDTSDTMEHLLRSLAAEVTFHIRGDAVQAEEIRSAKPPDREELIPADLSRDTRDAAKTQYQQKARVQGASSGSQRTKHQKGDGSSSDGGGQAKAKRKRNRRGKGGDGGAGKGAADHSKK